MTIGILALIMGFGGITAGAIGYTKQPDAGTFILFFILGACFPLFGIVIAALSKGPPKAAQSAGWYPDPWHQSPYRWHDGQDWTATLSATRSSATGGQ